MHQKPTRRIVASSLVWKFAERSGVQGVQFLVQVILARLLDPQQFGSIALVMVFVNLAQVFVQSGFNTALSRKRRRGRGFQLSVLPQSCGFFALSGAFLGVASHWSVL